MTSPGLAERYELLVSNKSEIQKRDVNQRISTIELAIFTDRSEDQGVGGFIVVKWQGTVRICERTLPGCVPRKGGQRYYYQPGLGKLLLF